MLTLVLTSVKALMEVWVGLRFTAGGQRANRGITSFLRLKL